MKVTKKAPERKREDRTRVLICPECGSTNIKYWTGYRPSAGYTCVDCDYKGGFIIQRRVVEGEDGEAEVE